VTAITPAAGPATGATSVIVSGTNLGRVMALANDAQKTKLQDTEIGDREASSCGHCDG
jgi:hypothetical protein